MSSEDQNENTEPSNPIESFHQNEGWNNGNEGQDSSGQEAQGQEEVYFDGFKIVELPIIDYSIGEEDELVTHEFKCRLFRWREDEWKERANFLMKFLQHEVTGKTRVLMKSSKTFLLRANFYLSNVNGFCELKKSETHQHSWTWKAWDCSEDAGGK